MNTEMTKSERCYRLKTEGMSWGEISSIVGIDRKSCPTLAKNYMLRHGMPHWGDTQQPTVSDSKKERDGDTQAIDELMRLRIMLEEMRDETDPRIRMLIQDIARESSGIVRSYKK